MQRGAAVINVADLLACAGSRALGFDFVRYLVRIDSVDPRHGFQPGLGEGVRQPHAEQPSARRPGLGKPVAQLRAHLCRIRFCPGPGHSSLRRCHCDRLAGSGFVAEGNRRLHDLLRMRYVCRPVPGIDLPYGTDRSAGTGQAEQDPSRLSAAATCRQYSPDALSAKYRTLPRLADRMHCT